MRVVQPLFALRNGEMPEYDRRFLDSFKVGGICRKNYTNTQVWHVMWKLAGTDLSLYEPQRFVVGKHQRAGIDGRGNLYRDEVVVRPVTTTMGRSKWRVL